MIKMIVFKNTEAIRAGKAIEELRHRNGLSLQEFADKAYLCSDYLTRLEEGFEDKVAEAIIERILEAGGLRCRGYTKEELKSILLSIQPAIPPKEKLI